MAGIYAGISGWRYVPWRRVFNPEGLPQRMELHYASRHMATIEINGSFYSLQRASSWQQWRDETPRGFIFSVKCPRFITHIRRLRDIAAPLANFYASGVLALREKLGPMLWQFPPNMSFDAPLWDEFLAQLPRDFKQAATIAANHNDKLKYTPCYEVDRNRKLRHAVEIRHESFITPGFFELLRRHKVAFVLADTAGKWPYAEEITSDFCYLRLHGDKELYVSGYTDEALHQWGERIRAWHQGQQPYDAPRNQTATPPAAKQRDVFIYFDNDVKVHAPFDAMTLMQMLGRATPAMQERLAQRYTANPDIPKDPGKAAIPRKRPPATRSSPSAPKTT